MTGRMRDICFLVFSFLNMERSIGSLLYLTTSRYDIMFNVCLCVCFQSNPREIHLGAIKRIFRYLKGNTNLALCYKKQENCTL